MVKAKYKIDINGEKKELDTGVLLLCDNEDGEGYVKMEDYFVKKSVLFKMDCIEDWIDELQETYEQLKPVWEGQLKAMRDKEK